MKDEIRVLGTLVLEIVKDGEVIATETHKNLVVSTGKQSLAVLLAAGTSGRVVTQIGVGTGSAEPALGNVALTDSFVKNLSGFTYPNPNQVAFSFSILQGEANGKTITEMGLFTANNTLFNRIIRAPIIKDSSIGINGTWTIEF